MALDRLSLRIPPVLFSIHSMTQAQTSTDANSLSLQVHYSSVATFPGCLRQCIELLIVSPSLYFKSAVKKGA